MALQKLVTQSGKSPKTAYSSLLMDPLIRAVLGLLAFFVTSLSVVAQPMPTSGTSGSPPASVSLGDQARGPVLLDRVVAVVNNDVIVESELLRRLEQVRRNLQRTGQPLPLDQVLRDQVLDRMTTDLALLQRALEAGLRVDDPSLDRAIARLAESNGLTVVALKNQLRTEGVRFEAFREDIRDEITISRLRERDVENRLRVSDSEIDAFLESQGQSLAKVQEWQLSQILIPLAFDASEQEIRAASQQMMDWAQSVRKAEASFLELAKQHSKSPEASQGGSLGWRSQERMPALFFQAVKDLQAGELTPPLRSGNGLHLLRVDDRRVALGELVDVYRARHILIRVDANTSEEQAARRLADVRDRLRLGEPFERLARAISQDPGSASKGGELDWAYPGDLVPEFERALAQLRPGEISPPVRTMFGLHLIELLERKREPLSEERFRLAARLALRDRKLSEAVNDWMREVRANSYVEIKP
jgi:peptidyl-prolyl cis-trans isomerase SurA